MIEMEVRRLRRLRAVALKARSVARVLQGSSDSRGRVLAGQAACAAWRVARAATGRLRSHPNVSCQRDAGLGMLVVNGFAANRALLHRKDRTSTIRELGRQFSSVYRELADVRALTWATDLSDTLGRSLKEIRLLLTSMNSELAGTGYMAGAHDLLTAASAGRGGSVDRDWPFLAI